MTTQSLFGEVQAPATRPSIEERFDAFHRANPWVMSELVKRVATLKAQGGRYVSLKYLVEGLRHEHARDLKQTGEFKIDNSITAVYSERIRAAHPELADMLRARKRTAA